MIGQSVAHYKVTDRLGVGGMGEVYRAHDSKLHRDVALKVLPAALAHDPDYMARFAREATVLASLNHPNIAAVYGLEESQGATALVMELIPGETLADRIQRGPIPVEEAAAIALQIAQALEEAHEHGIIHRDLKPANVKITPEGRVKVLDFGLAKAIEGNSTAVGLTHSPTISLAATQAGVILGTAGYMSPEQAAAQRTDRRSDIWAFGVVLLEMLTGKRTFTGETVSHVLAAVLHGSPDLSGVPAAVPPRIKELLQRCLTKNAKSRLQSIGDARVLLEEYVAAPASFAEKPTSAAAAAASPRRSAVIPWAVAALGAAIAIGAVVWGSRPSAAPAAQPVRLRAEIGPEPLFLGSGASAVLSPDGRHLALSLGTGQTRNLYVRSLDQLTVTQLPGTEVAYNPFFSPDGQWIGFVTPTQVKKVSIAGGTPITLCPSNRSRGASWGENDVIVFAESPSSALSTVPAAGGKPSPLTTLDSAKAEFSHRWPQWLPGEKKILFTSLASGESSAGGVLEVLDVASGERKVIHQGGVYGRYLPSGHLVYLNEGTLFAAPFDLDRLELPRTPAPVVQGVAETGGAHFDISQNGTLVYLEGLAGSPKYELVAVDRRGSASPLTAERQTFVEPRFSPDGRRLAAEVITGTSSDSWVYDLDRGTVTRLTFGDGPDSVPVWSPDGAWIVYASTREEHSGLYRKRADGSGEEELLLEGDSLYGSSWSRDGRFILYGIVAPTQTGNDIWVLPLDGDRTPQPYVATEFSEAEAAFSPDGRWVAYNSDDSGRSEVYVRPFPASGGKWQVSAAGGSHPRWRSDGKELYFRNDSGVMSVEVDTTGSALRVGTPSQLFEGPFLRAAIGGSIYADYDVAPDGQRFVMLRGESRLSVPDHVIVVLDFFKELEATFPHH
ncbi:MAG TPA: protein kinase [Thermoanaerobaculia bacterium]|nr:protein kinase [Thermoanaerobaculia bacterium]